MSVNLARYPRLHRAICLALADANWLCRHTVSVNPIDNKVSLGLTTRVGAGQRFKSIVLDSAVAEAHPEIDAEVVAIIKAVRKELTRGELSFWACWSCGHEYETHVGKETVPDCPKCGEAASDG